jgi:hypothetical protein
MLRKSMREKPFCECRLLVECPEHLRFLDAQSGCAHDRRRDPHSNRLVSEAPFAKEISGTEHAYDRLLAARGQHRQLHRPSWM